MWGLARVRRLGRRLKLLLEPHGIILLYHRVAEPDGDPQLLCVSPKNFQEHLNIISEQYQPLSLQELVRRLDARRLPKRFAVITFDDGYADNLLNAKPLLESHNVPATVFVSTGYLGSSQGFWWDELESLLLSPAKETANRRDMPENSTPSAQHELYQVLCGKLGLLPQVDRRKVLDDLRRQHAPGPEFRPGCRVMTTDQVRTLGKDGLVEVGAHTVNHPVLSQLLLDEQHREIVDSKARLEEILGWPVRSFSYPFGGRSDYAAETVGLVREAGFDCACANFFGVVMRNSGRFELPRFLVRNWDGEEFARRLARRFHG